MVEVRMKASPPESPLMITTAGWIAQSSGGTVIVSVPHIRTGGLCLSGVSEGQDHPYCGSS